MKKLRAIDLIYTITLHEADKDYYKIEARDCFRLEDSLMQSQPYIRCYLGGGAFDDVIDYYPFNVSFNDGKVRTYIELKNLKELRDKLTKHLKWVLDEELYDIVWKEWTKIKNIENEN